MTEMHYVSVFLNEDALVQLEDEFVDKEDDLRHLVYDPVKTIAKAAKMILLNKQVVCNTYDESAPNKAGQETIQLEDVDLEKFNVKSDPDWRPENVSEDGKPYRIRVGEKTWNWLITYFQVYQLRVKEYNKTLPRKLQDDEKRAAKPATCYEQILHEALIAPVMQRIDKSLDEELEDDFTEANKSKKDKAKEKSKEKAKSRSGKKDS